MDKKVITLKTQRNAENACGNRMWQLGFIEAVEEGVIAYKCLKKSVQ